MRSTATMRRVPALVVMLATALLVLSAAGAAADEPDLQVSVFSGTVEIGAFEPFFVQHGWVLGLCEDGEPPGDLQAQIDAKDPRFDLSVDGQLQEAELVAGCFTAPNGSEFVHKFHRVVFADGLAPGSYALVGQWWDAEGGLGEQHLTLHVKPGAAPFMPPGLMDERPTGPPAGVPPSRP